jgi:nucleoside-diphosphate-sugar epimerase
LAAVHDLSDMTNENVGLSAYNANTNGTKNLLNALSKLSAIKRVIFTSTQLISELGHQVVSLNDARPSTFYGKSKLIGEKMICSFNKKPYVWMIVRPTTIWGPGMMQQYGRFIKYIEKGWYFHLTNKPLFKSYGYIENVAYQYV